MSSAVVAAGYGGPENLSLVSETLGEPGPGQVLVEVRAVGTNPYDFKSYANVDGDPAKLPLRIGSEASGVVIGVGEGAEGTVGAVAVGDEVIVYGGFWGTYASQLLVPGGSITPKPSSVPFEQAAGLLQAGVVGLHMVDTTGVQSGETVLIHGAAGGVGQMATQAAVARGARVIGTALPDAHDALRSLGATPVVFGDGLADRVAALAAPDGVDVAMDCAGSDEALHVSLALVTSPERRVSLVNAAFVEHGGRLLGSVPSDNAERSALRPAVAQLAGDGKLHVTVDRTFALADAAEAHRYLAAGKARGKVVLIP